MASEYRFVTTWCLQAPVEKVFDALHDSARWPEWWKGVERADMLEPGGEDGIGRRWHYVWRSRLPYSLGFDSIVTRIERPWLLEGEASGELNGIGRWRLHEGNGVTAVVYEWNVSTSRAWMNRMAPVARPLFAWNHDVVMRQGADGLARLLDAPLLVRS
jgi:hypothetical protein